MAYVVVCFAHVHLRAVLNAHWSMTTSTRLPDSNEGYARSVSILPGSRFPKQYCRGKEKVQFVCGGLFLSGKRPTTRSGLALPEY